MMKYLVVGKSGYIAKSFLKRNLAKVYCTTSNIENKHDIYLDLRRASEFDYSLIDENTFVIFLAAISSPDHCLENYNDAFDINVKGTKYFIDKALSRNSRVLFFSSDIVYGESRVVVDENTKRKPVGSYGEVKAKIENTFLNRKNFKVFRLSYVLSSKDKFVKYLVNCMDSKEVAEIYDPLDRSVVHLDDVIDSIIEVSRQWSEFCPSVVNMAGPSLTSRKDIANYVSELFPGDLKFNVVTPDEKFYDARPKVINMKSIHITGLLKRNTTTIKQALQIELQKKD